MKRDEKKIMKKNDVLLKNFLEVVAHFFKEYSDGLVGDGIKHKKVT